MIRPCHIDEFAGGGGASEGHRIAMEIKNRLVRTAAVNHDQEAVCMYRMNHTRAQTFCQDVFKIDPIDMLKALGYSMEEILAAAAGSGLLPFLIESGWFSPDCKHFSKAKGAALLDKRIRGLAWILLKWCGRMGGGQFRRGPACPGVMFLENVEEFQTFGPLIADRCKLTGRVIKRDGSVAAPGERVPYWEQKLVPDPKRKGLYFRRLVAWLRSFGAVVEWRELRACDYGAPTIRKRLFMIIRFDGQPIVWPEATHGDPDSEEVKSGKLLPWVPAAAILDFTLPCPSVFMTRKQAQAFKRKTGIKIQRPLADDSHHRLAWGVKRFVMDAAEPFIVPLTHQGPPRGQSVKEPLKTITGANRGEQALVVPGLAQFISENSNASHQRSFSANEPLRTICAQVKGGHFSAVAASLVKMRGSSKSHPPGSSLAEPVPTISAGGQHHALSVAYLAQHNTGEEGHSLAQPVSTLTGKCSHQQLTFAALAKYYGSEQAPEMTGPLHTVTTKDRFALIEAQGVIPILTPELARKARRVARWLRSHGVEFEGEFAMCGEYVIVDVGMRMLTPRELYRAQGFPEGYIIDRGITPDGEVILLSKTAQVKMCGNSVSPLVAAAIMLANLNTPIETSEVAA
jgi:DNA (cytosine-5)-methyltransferase 1